MPGLRGVDGREQIGLAKGFDQIAEDPGLDRAGHEILLRVRSQHDDRNGSFCEDPAGGLDAVEEPYLDVEDREVGLLPPSELNRLLAVLRLCADLEAGALDQLTKVESDDRLILGQQDSHTGNATSARSPASPPRVSVPPSSS